MYTLIQHVIYLYYLLGNDLTLNVTFFVAFRLINYSKDASEVLNSKCNKLYKIAGIKIKLKYNLLKR